MHCEGLFDIVGGLILSYVFTEAAASLLLSSFERLAGRLLAAASCSQNNRSVGKGVCDGSSVLPAIVDLAIVGL